ncbi:MAG: shikimate kinase [Pyrinomonadaceae bacterium]
MKKSRSIVITGFMGSGKTTIADALARRLDCSMVDLDSFIAECEGRTPARIIAEDGEPAFREIESNALRDSLTQIEVGVIALGGGAWTIAANRQLIEQHDCVTVWLDAPFDLCWERIAGTSNSIRPLAPDRELARELYNRRRSTYEMAALKVELDGSEDAAGVAARIQKELDSQ